MADPPPSLSGDPKDMAKQYEEYTVKVSEHHAFVQQLLKLLAEKDQANEDLKIDLDDQTESRRRWQKRATEIESRIACVQHLLVLIDGNQHFFKSDFIRAGTTGAREALGAFLSEVKEFAKAQHKNDLPEDVSVVVHIFSDIGRLAHDLSTASLLPAPDQLWTFIQDVSKLEPRFTISDCGSGHQAVDAKLKQFYELYIENCHCRHVFLALGPDAEYYNTLQLYSDDDYTKGKTSLTRPSQGFAPGFSVPFHTVEFSTLVSVPQASALPAKGSHQINGSSSLPHRNDDRSVRTSTTTLHKTKSEEHKSPTAFFQPDNHLPSNSGIESGKQSPKLPTASTPSHKASSIPQDETNNFSKESEDPSSVRVVKLHSSTHSSQSSKAAEQTWETSVSDNNYAPTPIEGDWGEPVPESNMAGAGGTQSSAHTTAYSLRTTNGHRNRTQNPSWRQDQTASKVHARPMRQAPRQFEGSWDDLVEHNPVERPGGTSSPTPCSKPTPTPRAASLANGFSAAAFTRKAVTMPEPYPQERPVRSPIALNKAGQRIDLHLPKSNGETVAQFELRSRTRRLCNEHQLRSSCHNSRCPYDHEPISDGVYLVLRNKARTLACSAGPSCRRHDCFGSHHCPNVTYSSTCGRPNCPFEAKGMHGVSDLDIVQTIEPPAL